MKSKAKLCKIMLWASLIAAMILLISTMIGKMCHKKKKSCQCAPCQPQGEGSGDKSTADCCCPSGENADNQNAEDPCQTDSQNGGCGGVC